MKRRSFFITIAALTLTLTLGYVFPAFAAAGGLVPCDGTEANPCTPCHLVQLLANIGQFLVGITGALVFAMFVYGSFEWIISAGNEKRVEAGKSIMINAFIGVLIVFLSYTIVTFFIYALTGNNPYNKDQQILFGRTWGQLVECSTTPVETNSSSTTTTQTSVALPKCSQTSKATAQCDCIGATTNIGQYCCTRTEGAVDSPDFQVFGWPSDTACSGSASSSTTTTPPPAALCATLPQSRTCNISSIGPGYCLTSADQQLYASCHPGQPLDCSKSPSSVIPEDTQCPRNDQNCCL